MKKVFATMMLATMLTGGLFAMSMPQTPPAKTGMAPAAGASTAVAKKPAKKRRHHRAAKK